MRRLLPLLITLSPLASLLSPSVAVAADYQQCTTGTTCTIGEFLYDDNYTPITGATCTLTVKNPDNSSLLNSVNMTSGADGWYSYDIAPGNTEGLYHSNICCNPASGTLCLDKSFEVKAASGNSLTPAAIWGYSDRTLTGYGTLVSDIWNYSNRSLTSFGSLVSDIWGYSSRTMTNFGSLVENIWGAKPSDLAASSSSPSTLSAVLAEQKTQREMLEKLVNAPIVTLELSDSEKPDLSLKLSESKKQASLLYDAVVSTKSRLLALDLKWNKLSPSSRDLELTNLSQTWSNPNGLVELTTAWNNPILDSLNQKSTQTKSAISTLLASASLSTSSTLPPSQLYSAIDSLTSFETELGDITSPSGDSTLFGFLASVEDRNQLLTNEGHKLAQILEDWDSQGEAILTNRIHDSQAKILAINEFPGGDSIVQPSNAKANPKLALKNLLFSLQGLIGLNQNLLAASANTPVRGLWLEEGSIIFRAVLTNPSKIISQSVPVKFFLPRELSDKDIQTIDPNLSATYDPNQEMLAVTGTFDLGPGATKIVAVEVNDVWQLKPEELTALKTKADALVQALGNTTYESQGLVLKNSIITDIDDLLHTQNDNIKPENRIRAYRQAQLALNSTQNNLTQLENLTALANNNNSLLGFVGGVSTTAVFGIILVIVAGFVFLSLYFKKLSGPVSADAPKTNHLSQPTPLVSTPLAVSEQSIIKWQMPALIASVMVITASATIYLTRPPQSPNPTTINQVTPPSPTQFPSPTPTLSPAPTPTPPSALTSHTLLVPDNSTINIRNKPSSAADIIMAISENQDIIIFKESGDWANIGFTQSDATKGYWVHRQFIIDK